MLEEQALKLMHTSVRNMEEMWVLTLIPTVTLLRVTFWVNITDKKIGKHKVLTLLDVMAMRTVDCMAIGHVPMIYMYVLTVGGVEQ